MDRLRTTKFRGKAIRNILQNVVKHGTSRDRVVVSARLMDQSHRTRTDDMTEERQANGYLRITYRSYGHQVDIDVVDQLGYQPTSKQEGSPRYGIFLIGMIARLLGGTVNAASGGAKGGLLLQVDLPMKH